MTGGKGGFFEYILGIQLFPQFPLRETETVALVKCVPNISWSTLQSSASQSANSGWIYSYFMSDVNLWNLKDSVPFLRCFVLKIAVGTSLSSRDSRTGQEVH